MIIKLCLEFDNPELRAILTDVDEQPTCFVDLRAFECIRSNPAQMGNNLCYTHVVKTELTLHPHCNGTFPIELCFGGGAPPEIRMDIPRRYTGGFKLCGFSCAQETIQSRSSISDEINLQQCSKSDLAVYLTEMLKHHSSVFSVIPHPNSIKNADWINDIVGSLFEILEYPTTNAE